MNARGLLLAAMTAFCSAPGAGAADLQVIAGGGIAGPLKEIAARFEKTTGHRVVIRYGTTPELVKMATGGPFDLGIVPVDVLASDAARPTFAAGHAPTVARVGIGVAVRSGAPRPDIGTPEALRRTLLGAKSIASIPASATGTLLARIYERLGITEAMKERIRPQPTPGDIARTVASGENELGVFLTNVLTAPGIDLVGPFPPEVQMDVVYTAAVSSGTREGAAAEAFIAFLRSSESAAVIRAMGMNPS